MELRSGQDSSIKDKSTATALPPLISTFGGPAIMLIASLAAAAAELYVRPRSRRTRVAVRAIGAIGAAAPWIYQLGAHPSIQHRADKDEKAYEPLPGDDIVPHALYETTHAITINAPAEKIWPWLVQLRDGRGRRKSYDWLENLISLNTESANNIRPELRHLKVGDIVRLSTEGDGALTVEMVEPNRLLALHAGPFNPLNGRPVRSNNPESEPYLDWSWAFILTKIDDSRTRLSIRIRSDYSAPAHVDPAIHAVVGPPHFIIERKMLRGIKDRAERAS